MTTKRIEWEKDGSCWEIDGCTSRRLSGEKEHISPEASNSNNSQKQHNSIKIKKSKKHIQNKLLNSDIRKPISLTITEESSETNIYPDINLNDNEYIYFSDWDGQNKDHIRKGAHLHHRKKTGTQYKFIGIVIECKKGATPRTLTNKKGEEAYVDYYILKIHPTMKSLGLNLPPKTIVQEIREKHPKCILVKKDGTPRKAINGQMKYQYDSCTNSGIRILHTAPQRGILY
jgi:hypothetical protein